MAMKIKDLLGLPTPAAGGKQPLKAAGIQPGLYAFARESQGAVTRFHLRVDPSADGLLLADASALVRLRPSGTIIAKGLLEGLSAEAIGRKLSSAFRKLPPDQAASDIQRVQGLLDRLAVPSDDYPVLNLGDATAAGQFAPPDRPISADIPLAEPARMSILLDRLWSESIPHATIIAGPQPDADALVRTVEHAGDLGMIAGVRCQGTALVDARLVDPLAQVGVDHVDILYLSADDQAHDALAGPGDRAKAVEALAQVHQCEVCAVAEIALVEDTLATIEETIDSLGSLGVRNAAFYAVAMTAGKSTGGALGADKLLAAADSVEQAAEEADLRLFWYPPVRFHLGAALPAQVRGGPRCGGDLSIRLEPDGSVIAPRGPRHPAGNLLYDPWDKIRSSSPYREFLQRVQNDTHCSTCPGLAICEADCPRDPEGWADGV